MTLTPEDLKERLKSLGYAATEEDQYLLGFSISKSEQTIKEYINADIVPDGLLYDWTDMAAGEFLHGKFLSGLADEESGPVTSIKEGDVSVNFDTSGEGSSIVKLKQLVGSLIVLDPTKVAHYRRLKW